MKGNFKKNKRESWIVLFFSSFYESSSALDAHNIFSFTYMYYFFGFVSTSIRALINSSAGAL